MVKYKDESELEAANVQKENKVWKAYKKPVRTTAEDHKSVSLEYKKMRGGSGLSHSTANMIDCISTHWDQYLYA